MIVYDPDGFEIGRIDIVLGTVAPFRLQLVREPFGVRAGRFSSLEAAIKEAEAQSDRR